MSNWFDDMSETMQKGEQQMSSNLKPIKVKERTVRDIFKQAKAFYPNSKTLRHQWIRQTLKLLAEKKHVLYNGRAEAWKITVLKK